MKRTLLFLYLILCLSSVALAQQATVKQANDLYGKGNYSAAAQLYEKIIATEGIAPELYYNLGNAYYKMNETGKSILNYERALRLSPSYEDARVNLEMAQMKVVDNIVYPSSFFVGRWIESLIKLLSSNQWIFVSFSVFIVSLVLVFIFIFASSLRLRNASFYAGAVLVVFSGLTFVFSGVRKNQQINHHEAIIMAGTVTIKSSPDRSGTDLFQLHEGTKVVLKSTLGNWTEIKLGNGNIGWIEQENVEKI